MSNGMRSAIVSIGVIVSSMFPRLKAGIFENVEPHHSPATRACPFVVSLDSENLHERGAL